MTIEHWTTGNFDVTRGPDGRFITWSKVEAPLPPPISVPTRLFPEIIEEEEFYFRASVGLNFWVTHVYYGALIQEWFITEGEAEEAIDGLRMDLIRKVERFVGYPEGEWWFPARVGSGVQEVTETRARYEVVMENFNARDEAET